jgi:PST family polysaccharide transporter
MAMVFIGIAQIFTDFGIGSAIIQSQSEDSRTLSSAFWANLCVAGVLAVAVALLSPVVAAFYGAPRVAPLVAVAGLTLVIAGLLVVPQAYLLMKMRFDAVAKAQVLGTLAGSATAITVAVAGGGVWSLVTQPIAGSTASLVAMFWLSKWRPRIVFSWASVRGFARFSAGVVASDVMTFAGRNADQMLIGRFLGSGPLGYYALAYQMMLYPLQQVSSVFVRVLFPTLSLLRPDSVRYGEAYLRAAAAIAFITFPMMMGLFAVAEPFVAVVFGSKWHPVADLVRVLALVGMIQSIGTTVGTIYLSTGNTRVMFNVAAIGTVVIIAGVSVGLQWGIQGVAVGYALASISIFYYTIVKAFSLVSLTIRDLHLALWRPLLCATVMLVVVLAASSRLDSSGNLVRLLALIVAGIFSYAIASWLLNRKQVMDLFQLGRRAFIKQHAHG